MRNKHPQFEGPDGRSVVGMADRLVVPCPLVEGSDRTVFTWDLGQLQDSFRLSVRHVQGSDVLASNYMTTEQARELFSWLGARLHGV